MIHTTVGIYPNKPSKINGVRTEDLEEHIRYNRVNRPGRMLMVDGEVKLEGYGNGNQCNIKFLDEMRLKKRIKCTAPYK